MKIIKEGKPPVYVPMVKRFTCDKCGCVFEANDDEMDVHRDFIDEVKNGRFVVTLTSDIVYATNCPCCRCIVSIKEALL